VPVREKPASWAFRDLPPPEKALPPDPLLDRKLKDLRSLPALTTEVFEPQREPPSIPCWPEGSPQAQRVPDPSRPTVVMHMGPIGSAYE
jgi:hypothetical protein